MRNRRIVVLQIKENYLVKTVGRSIHRYIGDPLNAVVQFSEKQVDEIILMDIDSDGPVKFELLETVAKYSQAPLSYCGRIKSPEQVERIVSAGFERVFIGGLALVEFEGAAQIAQVFGSSTVGLIINYENADNRMIVHPHLGTRIFLVDFLKNRNLDMFGEVLLYNLSADGQRIGFDAEVVDIFRDEHSNNIILQGGGKSVAQSKAIRDEFPFVNIAAGAAFTLKAPLDAVLIKY